MNTRRVAKAQLRVVLAFQHLVMLDERFTEKFEGPGVALDGGQAFLVGHGDTCFTACWIERGKKLGIGHQAMHEWAVNTVVI